MKKGQTATEYLIILGVVIIIALIVVGVCGGLPIGKDRLAKAEEFCAKEYMNYLNHSDTAITCGAGDKVTVFPYDWSGEG